ncbi:heavy-metal-associated domain-containing protein [Pseudarthrobacter sp. S9]|uniref:heavy-metal-associated domain-containing protein n=1 Tax=Pseudarthrobacter sp. S9 TaxID=3418421 RepID=UPI003D05FBF3
MCGTEPYAHNHHHGETSAEPIGDRSPAEASGPVPAGSEASAYGLEGLDCGHCVETVEKAVAAVPGVESATVDLVPDGISRLTVSGTVDEAALSDAVVAAGYSFSTR